MNDEWYISVFSYIISTCAYEQRQIHSSAYFQANHIHTTHCRYKVLIESMRCFEQNAIIFNHLTWYQRWRFTCAHTTHTFFLSTIQILPSALLTEWVLRCFLLECNMPSWSDYKVVSKMFWQGNMMKCECFALIYSIDSGRGWNYVVIVMVMVLGA